LLISSSNPHPYCTSHLAHSSTLCPLVHPPHTDVIPLLQDGIFEVKTVASIQDAASGNKREVRVSVHGLSVYHTCFDRWC